MEREEMPCCAAWEQSDQHSAQLQHVRFSLFNLQKEQFFLQEHTALLRSFPLWGYKISSRDHVRQSQLQRQSLALVGCSRSRGAFREFTITLQRKSEPTFSQLCRAFGPACHKFWSIKLVC